MLCINSEVMTDPQEQENYLRMLFLVYDVGTSTKRSILANHIIKKGLNTLEEFIDKNQHDIYHYFDSRKCCLCMTDMSSTKTVLLPNQIQLIFDINRNQRKCGHRYGKNNRFCCLKSANISLKELDFTLLRFFIINFCDDVIWDDCLQSYNNNFETFLDKEKHNIYHMWKSNTACCLCRTGYVPPKQCIHSEQQYQLMFQFTKNSCNDDTCGYSVLPGLTYDKLKNDDKSLFINLTNAFCPLREAIETLTTERNNLAHALQLRLDQTLFERSWNNVSAAIERIASATNTLNDVRKNISDIKEQHFNVRLCLHKLENILRDNQNMQDIYGAIENLVEDLKETGKRLSQLEETVQHNFETVQQNTEAVQQIKDAVQQNTEAVQQQIKDAVQQNKEAMQQQITEAVQQNMEAVQQVMKALQQNKEAEQQNKEAIEKVYALLERLHIKGTVSNQDQIEITTQDRHKSFRLWLPSIRREIRLKVNKLTDKHSDAENPPINEEENMPLNQLPVPGPALPIFFTPSRHRPVDGCILDVMEAEKSSQGFYRRASSLEGLDKQKPTDLDKTSENSGEISDLDSSDDEDSPAAVTPSIMNAVYASASNVIGWCLSTARKILHVYKKDEDEDSFKCGPCGSEFNKMQDFLAHKDVCVGRTKTKKYTSDSSNTSAAKDKYIKVTVKGMGETWEKGTVEYSKENIHRLNVDGAEVLYGELGSLTVWIKSSATSLSSRSGLVSLVNSFLKNLFRTCPVEENKTIPVEVNVEIFEEISDADEEGDIYRCGRCNYECSSFTTFLRHKTDKCQTHQESINPNKDVLSVGDSLAEHASFQGKKLSSMTVQEQENLYRHSTVIGKVYGKKTETKQRLYDVAKPPSTFLQLQSTFLKQCQGDENEDYVPAYQKLKGQKGIEDARKSTDTKHHIIQHEQDVYSLDYNFKVNVWISDIKVLHDDVLVIADYNGKQLVTCDITGQQQHTIPLPGGPWCIAVVDNNTVAVSLYHYTTVVIVDVRQRQVIQHIDVKVWCGGVMYRDNQLFVGCYDETIKVMNMSGEVTRTIPVGVVPYHICGGEAGRIYYTDRDKLYCIDTVGNTLFTFTDPNMSGPRGITTDDEGHVLVICRWSKDVLRISPDGKQSQVIITQILSLSPHICYNSLSKSVVIGHHDNVYVYKKV